MGQIQVTKARLCARGDQQQEGVDYKETFASVMRFDTLRYLLAKAAMEDLEIRHLDVNTAFLIPWLREKLFAHLPQFYKRIDPSVVGRQAYVQLNKTIYGLKQSPRE